MQSKIQLIHCRVWAVNGSQGPVAGSGGSGSEAEPLMLRLANVLVGLQVKWEDSLLVEKILPHDQRA